MDIRWMKYKNENGEEEKFYPITHASAVVGLDINEGDSIYEEKIVELITENSDITTSVLADEISGSNVEISPLVQNEINNINNKFNDFKLKCRLSQINNVSSISCDLNTLGLTNKGYCHKWELYLTDWSSGGSEFNMGIYRYSSPQDAEIIINQSGITCSLTEDRVLTINLGKAWSYVQLAVYYE